MVHPKIIVRPKEKIPFIIEKENVPSYHCLSCNKHKAALHFYASFINLKYKKCKQCIKFRELNLPDLVRIKRRLYKDLVNRKQKGLAQLFTLDKIRDYFELFEIKIENSFSCDNCQESSILMTKGFLS